MNNLCEFLGEELPKNLRKCSICGEKKPHSEYSVKPDRKDKLDTRCKSCMNEGRTLRSKLRKYAGPPPDVCQLCGRKSKYNLVVDHCHETDTFRGYICKSCNTGLGAFEDNLEGLNRAVRYLEKHDNI